MSLRESINSINTPYKPPRKVKCEEGTLPTGQSTVTHTDLEPVIARLDRLQASIDNLLAMCLREELEDSSAVDD